MKITITIDTENEAFQPEPQFEVRRILHDLTLSMALKEDRLSDLDGTKLLDRNGNTVGSVIVSDEGPWTVLLHDLVNLAGYRLEQTPQLQAVHDRARKLLDR